MFQLDSLSSMTSANDTPLEHKETDQKAESAVSSVGGFSESEASHLTRQESAEDLFSGDQPTDSSSSIPTTEKQAPKPRTKSGRCSC